MILEILENIYNLADTIPPEEEQNFTLFCLFGTQVYPALAYTAPI